MLIRLDDGRTLQVHDTGGSDDDVTVLWHHGSPQTGALLPPLVAATAERGMRLISYARPGYAASTAAPGRTVAAAADDVVLVLDALGIDTVATVGASGGAPHALACAALLPDRVTAVVSLAGLAPLHSHPTWSAGMRAEGALRAALEGRAARGRYAETDEFDPDSFTEGDWAALEGPWSSLGADAGQAEAGGPDGLIDDDVAFASPWGFDPATIEPPVLVVHGGHDRMVPASHSEWLIRTLPHAELWYRPRDGHVSVLAALPLTLDWITATAGTSL
ncbi:alpha/beta fold hydrolase [Georgenia faecalis]|uniref:alpha/beta fold hydrolase n=1 Tax=Georgenia faecalis TaxID=2483799 RepID=UPI000FD8DDB7|nr:alpha/beta fold hydrolase [Georgenia faecalis]